VHQVAITLLVFDTAAVGVSDGDILSQIDSIFVGRDDLLADYLKVFWGIHPATVIEYLFTFIINGELYLVSLLRRVLLIR
jgi:hypothetical protein